MTLKSFLRADAGAVAVDWTVMAASVVGLGLASAGAVQMGSGTLGERIRSALSSASVAQAIVRQNFGDGNLAGWSSTLVTQFGGWGPMLGPFGIGTHTTPLTYDVDLPEGVSDAVIAFYLVVADSWDGVAGRHGGLHTLGDSMRLMIDGQIITTQHFHQSDASTFGDRQATFQIGDATYNITMTMRDAPTHHIAGWNQRADQRWSVQIEAVGAPQAFQLGFSSTLDQHVGDESFGIQNFVISGG